MNTHLLQTKASRLYPDRPGHFDIVEVLTVIRHDGTWARFKLLGWDATEQARTEFEGPMVTGPWLGSFQIAAVIDNNGGTKGEREALKAGGLEIDIQDGDRLRVLRQGEWQVNFKWQGRDVFLSFARIA